MPRGNKAYTATVNRIVRRYGGTAEINGATHIRSPAGIIGVETEDTIRRGVRELKEMPGPVYVAVTNREALLEALHATARSHVGVMDPQGTIVKPAKSPV